MEAGCYCDRIFIIVEYSVFLLFICVSAGGSGPPVMSSAAASTDTTSSLGAGAQAAPPTGAAGAAFPPGDFFQNIIQMAANNGLRTLSGQPGLYHFTPCTLMVCDSIHATCLLLFCGNRC